MRGEEAICDIWQLTVRTKPSVWISPTYASNCHSGARCSTLNQFPVLCARERKARHVCSFFRVRCKTAHRHAPSAFFFSFCRCALRARSIPARCFLPHSRHEGAREHCLIITRNTRVFCEISAAIYRRTNNIPEARTDASYYVSITENTRTQSATVQTRHLVQVSLRTRVTVLCAQHLCCGPDNHRQALWSRTHVSTAQTSSTRLFTHLCTGTVSRDTRFVYATEWVTTP